MTVKEQLDDVIKWSNLKEVTDQCHKEGISMCLSYGKFHGNGLYEFKGNNDYLLELVDKGEINAAENRLFEIIETSGMPKDALGPLILMFYEHVNSKDDDFLAKAGFSREEILTGLRDAMSRIGMDVSEYVNI